MPPGRSGLIDEALAAAPLLVFVADEAMRYIAVNEYACDVLGYAHEEIVRLRVTDIAVESRAASDYSRMVEAGWLGGVAVLRAKDGGEILMRYRAAETEVGGKQAYVAVGWIE